MSVLRFWFTNKREIAKSPFKIPFQVPFKVAFKVAENHSNWLGMGIC